MKSRIAIQFKVGGTLVIDEVCITDPDPDQVLIKLHATGICHSQLHQMRDPKLKRPLVLGHEATGIVEKKGKNVTHVREGDHVILTWMNPLPAKTKKSDISKHFMSPLQTINKDLVHGVFIYTWGEHVTVSGGYVFPISKDYPTDVTSILGCAVATGCGAVMNTANVLPGNSVAVFGAGGVGLSAVCAASILGAYPIIAVDLHDKKLVFAKEFGATHLINSKKVNAVEAILDISIGGVDYAFDAIGVKATAEQLLSVTKEGGVGVKNDGGTAILIGYPPPEITIDPSHFVYYQRKYRGSNGAADPKKDFPKILNWYKEEKFPLDKLVSNRYKLENINQAYHELEAGEILGRGIIEF